MNKLNIAYIPTSKQKQFIAFAKDKQKISQGYCLNEKSIPHVTICQFYDKIEKTNLLWKKINSTIPLTLKLSFRKYSIITFDENIYWCSLLPDQASLLKQLFSQVSNFVKSIRNDAYDPHLTLFNYRLNDSTLTNHQYKPDLFIEDTFNLVIGEVDIQGQLINILINNKDIYKI